MADLLLITSVRTLDLLWPDGSMPAVEVAAVGERTAAAVDGAGRAGGPVGTVGACRSGDAGGRAARRLSGSCFLMPSAPIQMALEAITRAGHRPPGVRGLPDGSRGSRAHARCGP